MKEKLDTWEDGDRETWQHAPVFETKAAFLLDNSKGSTCIIKNKLHIRSRNDRLDHKGRNVKWESKKNTEKIHATAVNIVCL